MGSRKPYASAFAKCRQRWLARASSGLVLLLCTGAVAAGAAAGKSEPRKTIIDLQRYRQSTTLPMDDGSGSATLIDLNPYVGGWYVLTLERNGQAPRSYHLENPRPGQQQLALHSDGVALSIGGDTLDCALWRGVPDALERARSTGLPYAPLCDGRLYLRNRVAGTQTHIERVTDFLRDHVWHGERIVRFVREEFFQDKFAETARPGAGGQPDSAAPPDAPPAADVSAPAQGDTVLPEHLGLDLGDVTAMREGRWYAVAGAGGIFVSAIQPRRIAPDILDSDRSRVDALDPVEAAALDYLVAFDLSRFDLGFVLGTDHPRVNWSERAPASMRDAALPGPDGIGDTAPLVTNGMISPSLLPAVAAAFTGGFKREHGAFRYGALSQINGGSHYGFIEQGAVFSTLQPGLATIFVLDDDSVSMKTWTNDDNALLPHIRYARQNGVALLEYDAATATAVPGALVRRWGPGNWSGSVDEKLRTLRAGACMVDSGDRRFLVYGYFSTATPSAMARVFQSYGCRYAMHLDMNALEHTYLALYTHSNGQLTVQHLIDGMAVVDRKGGRQLAPRFLAFPDDRDFFYLTRKVQP
jgi:hypothetical protein